MFIIQVQSLQNQTKLESSKNLEAARTEKESADAQIAHLKNKVCGEHVVLYLKGLFQKICIHKKKLASRVTFES